MAAEISTSQNNHFFILLPMIVELDKHGQSVCLSIYLSHSVCFTLSVSLCVSECLTVSQDVCPSLTLIVTHLSLTHSLTPIL